MQKTKEYSQPPAAHLNNKQKDQKKATHFCQSGKSVVNIESKAILALMDRIGERFAHACELLMHCEGRVVVVGMGKSGHIGRKIASTLASTGTPSFYIHPGEANHGDLGMITRKDVVLAISNSGETPELMTILPLIKRLGVVLIVLTGQVTSTLATNATVYLDTSVDEEACPLGLAPTSSTTATLVMGDALAIALLEARGFTSNDFALFHPGGALGRRLLLAIDGLMHSGDDMPIVKHDSLLNEALIEVTEKSLGMTTVVDDAGKLLGVFTDGDLRRTVDQNRDIRTTKIADVMTKNCVTVHPKLLAAEALQIMQTNKITALVVVNDNNKPVGVLHMHHLLRAGVI